jgi:hypothetical protein
VRNTTGFKGVTYNRAIEKFQAAIKSNGRSIYLGIYATPEDAHEAYMRAAARYHGQFARAA